MKTTQQLHRLQEHFTRLAGAGVRVEEISGAIYVFGSELATLRLLKLYRTAAHVLHGFSENLDTWYIAIELKY